MMKNQEDNCVNRARNKVFFIALFLLVMVSASFSPGQIEAQQLGAVITFQETISTDEEGGKLIFPSFVFADVFHNEVYLIDGRSRIIVFTSDFFPLLTMDKRSGIETPQGLTVAPGGRLYVAQSVSKSNPRNRISVYSACLKWERDIYLSGFEGADSFVPYRLAIDKKGNLYVTSSSSAGVLVTDGNGRLLYKLSPEEDGRKIIFTYVTIDQEGRIYLVSEEEGRIYVYDENNKPVMKFGEKGGSSGKLSRPRAVGVDHRNGRMYVVDYMRHTITVFNREGDFIFEFGGLGWGEGWFQHPIDLDIDNEGRIIVADTFNQRVQVFNSW